MLRSPRPMKKHRNPIPEVSLTKHAFQWSCGSVHQVDKDQVKNGDRTRLGDDEESILKDARVLIFAAGLLVRILLITIYVDRDALAWIRAGQIIDAHGLSSLYSFEGSGYRYPPFWSYVCATAYSLDPVTDFQNNLFLVLIKSPLIIADSLTFYIITDFLRKKATPKLAALGGILYFLNPFVIYVGAYLGVFDSLVVMFLVLTVYFLDEQDPVGGGLAAGLAVLTKQYAFPLVLALFVLTCKNGERQKAFCFAGLILLIFGGASLPFLNYNRQSYIDAILYSTSGPIRQSSTGLWSVFWNLERHTPIEVISWFPWLENIDYDIFYGGLLIPLAIITMSKDISEDGICLIASLCFLCFSPQVHSQYLVLFIPFLIMEILRHELHPFWYFLTVLPMIFQAMPNSWQTMFITSIVLFLAFLGLLTQTVYDVVIRGQDRVELAKRRIPACFEYSSC